MTETTIDTDKIKNNDTFYNSNFLMALCSAPQKNDKGGQTIEQATVFFSCRDYLHDTIRNYLHKSDFEAKYRHQYVYGKSPKINLSKFRLLIASGMRPSVFEKKLKLGIKILNIYSKENNFQEIILKKVKHPNKKDCWILEGDKQWIKNPHLLSMVTLTLRIATDPGGYITAKNTESKDAVKQWYKYIINNYEHIRDILLLKQCYQKLFLVAKHHKTLFEGFTPSDLYTMQSEEFFHGKGGICALCTCETSHSELNKRAKNLFSKYKAK